MKAILTSILALLLLLPSIGTLILFTQFKLNQDQIAKTICIQRASPNNSCQGHCQLKKSLKKFEENERQFDSNKLKEKSELVYTSTWQEIFTEYPFYFYTKKNSFSYKITKPKDFNPTLFRPPLV